MRPKLGNVSLERLPTQLRTVANQSSRTFAAEPGEGGFGEAVPFAGTTVTGAE